jgi:hypothetical protein
MKKYCSLFYLATCCLVLAACGGKESAKSIAEKWCDLDKKVSMAANETDKEAAKEKRKAYEDKMEAKYGKDEKFMDEIEKETEKCEGK